MRHETTCANSKHQPCHAVYAHAPTPNKEQHKHLLAARLRGAPCVEVRRRLEARHACTAPPRPSDGHPRPHATASRHHAADVASARLPEVYAARWKSKSYRSPPRLSPRGAVTKVTFSTTAYSICPPQHYFGCVRLQRTAAAFSPPPVSRRPPRGTISATTPANPGRLDLV